MEYERWIQQAIQKINDLPAGQVFMLKDLFDGIEWSTLQRGQRHHLGRMFKNEVNQGRICNVVIIPSPAGTASTYQKL